MKDENKYNLREQIQRLRDRSRWSTNTADQIDYAARAEAAAEDYRELMGRECSEGGGI